jgi:hypothetical protein
MDLTETPLPNELDWYDFETRMRAVVVKLIEPTITKAADDRENIRILQHSNKKSIKRIEELEFLLQKDKSKNKLMDDIAKKISSVDVARQLGEGKLKAFLDRLDNDQDKFKHDSQMSRVLLKSIEERMELMESEIRRF